MVDSRSEMAATTPAADARCVGSHSWSEGSHVSPDHVFRPLKRQMGGRRLSSSEEVGNGYSWLFAKR